MSKKPVSLSEVLLSMSEFFKGDGPYLETKSSSQLFSAVTSMLDMVRYISNVAQTRDMHEKTALSMEVQERFAQSEEQLSVFHTEAVKRSIDLEKAAITELLAKYKSAVEPSKKESALQSVPLSESDKDSLLAEAEKAYNVIEFSKGTIH